MTRPGDRLRALAARVCCADAMALLIDPVIADMQAEHAEAMLHGRIWRSRWVRLAGYVAFAKVLVLCDRSATADSLRPLIRSGAWAFGATALVTMALVVPPYYQQRLYEGLVLDSLRAVLFLMPQALAISIPVGVTIGLAVGLAKHRVSARLGVLVVSLALLCSVGSLVNFAWVLPNANQAFRTVVFRRVSPVPPPKGDAELTFTELNQEIRRSGGFPVDSHGLDAFTRLEVMYHTRWAFAFATFALSLFMMSLLALSRRWWVIGIGTVGANLVYYAIVFYGRSLALDHQLSPPVAAWLPNGVFAMVSLALMMLRGRSERAEGSGLKA